MVTLEALTPAAVLVKSFRPLNFPLIRMETVLSEQPLSLSMWLPFCRSQNYDVLILLIVNFWEVGESLGVHLYLHLTCLHAADWRGDNGRVSLGERFLLIACAYILHIYLLYIDLYHECKTIGSCNVW